MITYDARVSIARPPHDVYTAMIDPDRYGEWTDMVDVRSDVGPIRVGSRGTFRLAGSPIKGDLRFEYVELEPDRRIVIRVDHPLLAWHSVSELTPTDTGTDLRYAGEIRLRGIRRLLEPFLAREVRAGEEAEAGRLKALVEGSAGAADGIDSGKMAAYP